MKKIERQEKSKSQRRAARKTARRTTMHPLIGKDLWELGKLKFAEKDTLAIWKEACRRRTKKINLRKGILHNLQSLADNLTVIFATDVTYSPSWQRKFQSMPNNLNLRN